MYYHYMIHMKAMQLIGRDVARDAIRYSRHSGENEKHCEYIQTLCDVRSGRQRKYRRC